MKAYKRYGAARKAAEGQPIIRVGKLYIVGIDALTEIAVINSVGTLAGWVTARHLDRLGNANWAKTSDPCPSTAFDDTNNQGATT
jgi:hypothetical protein